VGAGACGTTAGVAARFEGCLTPFLATRLAAFRCDWRGFALDFSGCLRLVFRATDFFDLLATFEDPLCGMGYEGLLDEG